MKLRAIFLGIIIIISTFGFANAAISASPATDVTSNSFNTTVSGITGSDVWIMWGGVSGIQNWITPNFTATGGVATATVIGTPIMGGMTIYYIPCDTTGCGPENSVTILQTTPVSQTNFGAGLTNITNSRFNPGVIQQSLADSYTSNAPFAVIVGIALFFFMIGIWSRTKSVRLIAILGVIIAPFVMYGTQGLYLGVPSTGILLVKGLLAAALAGILVVFIRR